MRVNLETKESCCARPGVACAALLKDLGALVCRILRVTQPCSCLPELCGLGSAPCSQQDLPGFILFLFIF